MSNTIEQLKSDLQQKDQKIQYKKLDGDERIIHATLNFPTLEKKENENKKPRILKEDWKKENLVIWDVEEKGFRTVNVKRIISYKEA